MIKAIYVPTQILESFKNEWIKKIDVQNTFKGKIIEINNDQIVKTKKSLAEEIKKYLK